MKADNNDSVCRETEITAENFADWSLLGQQ